MENKLNLYGVYPAVVVNTKDPKGQGRVSLRVASVLGSATSAWALPLGEINTPVKKGDAVLVQFIGGDVTQPVFSVAVATNPWQPQIDALNALQKFTTANTVVGVVTITPTPNSPTLRTVTYDLSDYSTFYGLATAQTSVPGTGVTGVGITNISDTSADVYITRVNNTDTNVFYMVYGTN